jgi:DNA adenine methylase
MQMTERVRASYHASPLRYPGGKAKLAPFFKTLVRDNLLLDGTYIEPFAGGGAVGLCLLLHGYVDRIFLNDLSTPIYAFWRAMLDHPDRFIERIQKVDLTTKEWLKQRQIFLDPVNGTSFEIGFATFYLNRTNHSGVLNAGMIGGHAQKSAYGLDARFNRQELAARVRRIARCRSKITVMNLDASELIANVQQISENNRPLLYIDPPYYRKGRDLYYDYYNPGDHSKLRDAIVRLDPQVLWVVSYDAEAEILALYRGFQSFRYDLSYSARNGRVGNEVMFLPKSVRTTQFAPRDVHDPHLLTGSHRLFTSGRLSD